jgi:hypothetical protein
MQQTTEVEKLLLGALLAIDAERKPRPLYSSLKAAALVIGEDPDNLPDAAYEAGKEFVQFELRKLVRDAVKYMDGVFDIIAKLSAELPTKQLAKNIEELQANVKEANLPFMFLAAVSKCAVDDVDCGYLAEQIIEAGKQLADKAPAKT